jgi:cysteine-rich repeat protein
VNGDLAVDSLDTQIAREKLVGATLSGAFDLSRCDFTGAAGPVCEVDDLVVLERVVRGVSTPLANSCPAHGGPSAVSRRTGKGSKRCAPIPCYNPTRRVLCVDAERAGMRGLLIAAVAIALVAGSANETSAALVIWETGSLSGYQSWDYTGCPLGSSARATGTFTFNSGDEDVPGVDYYAAATPGSPGTFDVCVATEPLDTWSGTFSGSNLLFGTTEGYWTLSLPWPEIGAILTLNGPITFDPQPPLDPMPPELTNLRMSALATVTGVDGGGYWFSGSLSMIADVCGDGDVAPPGEQCDDGNTDPGDCCSPTCQYESASTVCRADAGECDIEELCDGAGSCPADVFEPLDTACGNPGDGICDLQDTCDGSGVCDDHVEPNGTSCEDGYACTTGDTCSAGACIGGPAPDCDDDDPCTTDYCDAFLGCQNDPVGGPDTDGDTKPDSCDNCPFVANEPQTNSDELPPGDACQCGDVNGDLAVDSLDTQIAREKLVGATLSGAFDVARCDFTGAGGTVCEVDDLSVLERLVRRLPTPLENACPAYGAP